MTIIGIEITEGVSKKNGRPYSMGAVHTMTALAPPMGGSDNVARGMAGDKFECDPVLLRPIAHLPFPLSCEVEKQDVIRFGVRQQMIADIKPVELTRKSA